MTVDPEHEFFQNQSDFESPAGHVPVLLHEIVELLAPRPGGRYIDATFGGGGHTSAILARSAPNGRVLAIDADPDAIDRARNLAVLSDERLDVQQGNFRDIESLARNRGFGKVDGILMDLGLSSFQLGQPDRGFSFQQAGPLDMRFDPTSGTSVHDIVNTWPEQDLANLIFEFGEEPRSRTIAREIVCERTNEPISTTERLASIVTRALGGRRGRAIHPATRTFQALRIAVNDELEALRLGLVGAVNLLAAGGRLAVISFHSLEDRIVKLFFRLESTDCICPPETPICVCGHKASVRRVTRRAIKPSDEEQQANPRSRSAKLRVVERLP